ncbi:MAG TPA: exonuclease domain-containing protein [Pyrinomonadaceae bacterium]|nr:exonuclease domain-containing protein [Pyrinomonadaceae bacterium]
MRNFRNLVPDAALLQETIQHLRASGGRAKSVEVAEAVLQIPDPDPALATSLLSELFCEDWRLSVSEETHEVQMLCEDDECRSLDEADFVVFDVETTGPKTPPCRIMELGACRVSGGRIVAEFRTLVNPRMPIPPFISSLTGISDEMVADAPAFEEVAADWLSFADLSVLVAHNAIFDVRFINHELSLVYPGRRMPNAHLCTVSLARRLMPELKSFRLHALANHFSVSHRFRHRAGDDARATAEIFLFLLERLRRGGVRDIAGARRYRLAPAKKPRPEPATEAVAQAAEAAQARPATEPV